MAKKLLLLAVTLCVLLGCLYVYRQYLGAEFDVASDDTQDVLDIEVDPGDLGGIPIGQSDRPTWMAMTDDNGFRQAVFAADSRTERDGQQILTNPDIEIYLSDGSTLNITAAEAELEVDDVGGRVEPRRGKLSGDVHIRVLEENASSAAVDAAVAAENSASGHLVKLEIVTERLYFDNELQEISAPADVTLTSEQLQLFGRDLLIQWNTSPNSLRLLRLNSCRQLVYNFKASGDDDTAPGDEAADRSPSTTDNSNPPASNMANAAASSSREKPLQHYIMEFGGDVKIRSGKYNLDGVDKVQAVTTLRDLNDYRKLEFSAPAAPLSSSDEKSGPAKEAGSGSGDQVASATADDQLADKAVLSWSGPLTIVPFAPSAAADAPAAGQVVLQLAGSEIQVDADGVSAAGEKITCRESTLEIASVGDQLAEIDLGGGRVLRGRRIILDDKQMLLYVDGDGHMISPGKSLVDVVVPQDSSAIPDAAQVDAEAQTEDTESSASQKISVAGAKWSSGFSLKYKRTDSAGGRLVPTLAEFHGDVILISEGGSLEADDIAIYFSDTSRDSYTGIASQAALAAGEIRADKIMATGSVDFRLNDDDSAEKSATDVAANFATNPAANPTADHPVDTKNTDGIFAAASSNAYSMSLASEKMQLTLASDYTGRQYPLRAEASENVELLRGNDTIRSDSLTVDFEYDIIQLEGRNYRPVTMAAEGNVILASRRELAMADDQGSLPLSAAGDSLSSDLINGVHHLSGRDVVLYRGDNWIRGESLTVYSSDMQLMHRATMPAAGKAWVQMSRDLDGNILPEPKFALLQWSGGVEYSSDDSTLRVSDNVRLDSFPELTAQDALNATSLKRAFDSEGDHMRCDKLTASFVTASDKQLGVAPGLSEITANGNVKMLSRLQGDGGFLLRRMQLSGPQMMLDVLGGEFQIPAAGMLIIEDYSAGSDKLPTGSLAFSDAQDVYTQTTFAWENSMSLLYDLPEIIDEKAGLVRNGWTAIITGGATMRHRGGSSIVGLDSLNIRPPAADAAAVTRDLDCDRLLASFVKISPLNEKSTVKTAQWLDILDAIGSVIMVDGPYEVHGQRLSYDGRNQRALVSGDSGGGAAHVYYRPDDGSMLQSASQQLMLTGSQGKYEINIVDSFGGGVQ